MKKTTSIILVILITMTLSAGCSKNSSPGGSSKDSGSSQVSESSQDKPKETKKSLVLKFAGDGTAQSQLGKSVTYLADKWNDGEGKDTELKIEVYHNSQLGSKKEVTEQMLMGEGVMTTSDATYMSDYAKDFDIITGPFFFDSIEEMIKLNKTEWFKEQEGILEKNGIKILASNWIYGERHLMTKKPVKSPSELKGMKVRVPTNEVSQECIKAMGGIPTPLPYGEMYPALAQGVIDGAENPIATLFDAQLFENAKYVTLTGHQKMSTYVITGTKFFNKLSPDTQKLLLKFMSDVGEYHNKNNWLPDEEAAKKKMQEKGVQFISDFDKAAFTSGAAQAYKEIKKWTPGTYERVKKELAGVK